MLFVGRIDGQVKLHGYRIEPSEIAATLLQHDDVHDCAVVVRTDPPNDARLTAYVVTNDAFGETGDVSAARDADAVRVAQRSSRAAELRSFLAERLPAYMAPSAFVFLAALPLTPNGKLDRRALPVPDPAALEPSAADVAPRDAGEELLAGIWAEVLRRARISVHDRFFDLGGHSLLATQVVARVRQVFGVDLPLRALFERPTVAGLAGRIAALRTDGAAPLPPIARAARDAPLPLSFAQERLWFLDQLTPGLPSYNIPLRLRLVGQLDQGALRRSIDALVRRHEALRTTFVLHNAQPVQQIAPPAPVPLPLLDLTVLPSAHAAPLTDRLAQAVAQHPFDLARGPLLRLALVRLSATDHLLLVTLHHIIADGWSLGVITRELAVLYTAACANRPPALPPLPIQYADFALWQRTWLADGVLAAQLDAWKRQLHPPRVPLDLPLARTRPPVQSVAGATARLRIDPALTAQLHTLSRRAGVTLFMTLLAGFATLLARYSGQHDIAVGSPIANRTRPELEGLIGFFVNTLVLRCDLSGNPSGLALLERVRAVCLHAYAHQDLPFERLIETLDPTRDLSRHPLFQVMLVLQNAPQERLALSNLELRSETTDTGTARFDLLFSLSEGRDGLALACEYATELFSAAMITQVLRHYVALLASLASAPERRLGELALLTPAERAQVLVEWNATGADYPRDACLHDLATAQTERSPDAVALAFGGDESRKMTDESGPSAISRRPSSVHLTYAALDRRANRLAQHLRARGAGPEQRVAICMERSLDLIIGVLAILKAGSAYVPLDPAYPLERIAFMLEDSGATILLTNDERRTTNDARAHAARVTRHVSRVALAADWPIIDQLPDARPEVAVGPDNLAYVIYTSGSSGRPKGVLIAHRGVCNVIPASIRMLGLGPASRILQMASISFDASVLEIFLALCSGARLELADPEALVSPPDLARLVRSRAITMVAAVPSLLDLLAGERFPDLRTITVGGERCAAPTVNRWAPGRDLFNVYAPTEATIYATALRCAAPIAGDPPIGRPIANMRAYVLDRALGPAPIGVAGELYLGGVGLARGYHARPDLTAERFIPNSFGTMNDEDRTMKGPDSSFIVHRSSFGTRLYQTGDLARYRADGVIEFLGRIDTQVKLRGFRIELGEIESVLAQHEAVQTCVVLLREDAPGDKRLVAYLVTSDAWSITSSDSAALVTRRAFLTPELRSFLSKKLPDYMLPAAFVWLDALPLTPSGKLDRKALPAPDQQCSASVYVAPRDPVEELTAEIVATVLRREQVGIYDNFFELGGHSLLATQVVAHLATAFGVKLPVRVLFETPTVADLAARVARMHGIARQLGEQHAGVLEDVEEIEL